MGTVPAKGSSRVQQIYGWLDTQIEQDGYYYRLKIVENGGGNRYSEFMHIQTPCAAYQGQSGIVELYPNPTRGNLNIKFYNSQKTNLPATVQVLDVLGEVVLQTQKTLTTGMQVIDVSLEQLPAGTYTIELKNEHWSTVKKFVKIMIGELVSLVLKTLFDVLGKVQLNFLFFIQKNVASSIYL